METPEQQLASLSPEQRRLVERWLRQEQDVASTPPHSRLIPRRHATDAIPLSFAQQRLWFLHQLEPASSAYHFRTVIRLVGRLDITLLARSLNAIVQRHEALRTTFRFADGQLRQLIAPTLPLPLPLLDLSCLPPDLRDAQVQRLALHAITQPFDLEHGPLLRAALLRLAPDAHVLLLPMHHIITDGWSQGVQLRELAALYAALGAGAPSPLPELPIQYADYALWQRTWLQGSGRHGDTETRRHGDTETWRRFETPSPTPNTQHPTPIEAQLAYWKQQLAGLSPLDLPIDRPRPPLATHCGALAYLTFPARVLEALKGLSRHAGVTLFMTLLAALDVLLYRYTRQSDIVVGSPVAGRTRSELEGLIGLFVNMLALRTDLGGDPRFGELLRRVRKVALEAYAHQEVPFEQVIEELQLARDVGHNPVFEVMLVLQNSPMPALEAAGLSLQPLEVATSTAVLDLSLYLREMAQGLQVRVEYNSDLFDAATIGRLLGHLQVLLEGIASDPSQPISQLPLLSAEERRQLLVAWNATDAAYPQECCVHQLFEAQAVRTPDAIAVAFYRRPTTDDRLPTTDREPRTKNQESGTDDESKTQNSKLKTQNFSPIPHPSPPPALRLSPNTQHLTYAELNARADQLARYLQSLGIGAETLVGLCVERSVTMVVGVLGILKAGAAYLPLDPTHPQQRLAFVLEDARPQVVLTTTDDRRPTTDDRPTTNDQRASLHPFTSSPLHPFTPSRSVVDLRADWPIIAAQPAANPTSDVSPAHLAYVIYTSGSTGTPKGVQIPHRAVVNFLHSMRQAPGLSAQDTLLAVTTLTFDIAALELFLPLTVGARVVLVSRATASAGPDLLAALVASQATIMQATPATWRLLLAAGWCGDQRLTVLCGGEALSRDLAVQLLQRSAQVWNLYGPTETTIWSCRTQVDATPGPVLIGQPIANTAVYVLDAYRQPVPIGAPGELYIGGVGLARGYLNRPDLTAERFIPNPFTGVTGDGCWVLEDSALNTQHPSPNTRLYRTGDLARYRPNGAIEFLGRIDQQIKIRGFRIEPGEIETALGQHPAVRECVVLAREDTPGDGRLVAYVVPDHRPPTTDHRSETTDAEAEDGSSFIVHRSSFVTELRAFLQTRLPDYMIPTAFVLLDALPLNASGKIDRTRLPAPGRGRFGLESAFAAPRTRAEATLAAIWAAVLGHERIGVHDNFFALGGDSIRSIQVIARARQAGCDLTPGQIFRHQTIAELAAAIGTAGGAQGEQGLVIGPVPFLPVQLWFFERNLPPPYHWFISSLLQVERLLELGWLREALRHLLAHHDGLRMHVVREAGSWRQFIAAPAAALPLSYYDLSGLPEAAHSAAIIAAAAQAQADLSLADGPIMRVALMHLGAGRPARLLIVMHHLLGDAVSWQIVLEDLQTAYRQLSRGEPVQLPPKTSSLRQLSTRLAEYAGSDAARQTLEQYWLARPWHKVLPLPVDYPDGLAANTAESTCAIAVTLSAAETDALRRALRHHDAQIMELLLAVLGLALAPWTGSSALLVDVVGHGRETVFDDLDLSRTVGWLTVALPVLIDLEDARDPAAALRAVKRQLPNLSTRGIEFQSLRYLSPDPAVRASLAALPPYEIVFNYLGQAAEPAPEAAPIRPAPEAARVADLTIPPGFMRQSLLHCSGAIRAGRLALSLKYSANIHRHETIERLAQAFAAALRELIADS